MYRETYRGENLVQGNLKQKLKRKHEIAIGRARVISDNGEDFIRYDLVTERI